MTGSRELKAQREEARRQKQKEKRALRQGGLQPRSPGGRTLRARALIVCEGEKTEPRYFRAFGDSVRVDSVTVVGEGDNTLSLVERAIALRDGERERDPFTEVWVVFDRDSFPADRFNRAIHLAQQEGFKVAYTNEAFEAWYLMHFHYCDAALSRTTYKERLTTALGRTYRKNDPRMYEALKSRQLDAIRNAERLLATYGAAHDPETDNPSTTVHLLVKRLNDLR